MVYIWCLSTFPGKLLTINKAIGIVVSDYLLKNNISKMKFIEKSGLSRTHLFQTIKGEVSPTADTLMLLANGMNLSISTFMENVHIKMKID